MIRTHPSVQIVAIKIELASITIKARINIIEVNIGFSFFLIALNTKIDNIIAPISSDNTQYKIIFEVVKLNPV